MKSQQSDRCKTSCKECIFAVYDGITQTSCTANRLNTYAPDCIIPAYDNEKEFFVIDRFCNLYRNTKWNNGTVDVQKAQNESKISYNIIIKVSSELNNDNVNEICNLIENFDYEKKKITFAIVNEFNIDKDYRGRLFSFVKYKNVTVHEYQSFDSFMHEYLKSSKKSFHLSLTMDNIKDLDAAIAFNNFVNYELKEALIFKYNESYVISNMAYKIEAITSELNNYTKIIENIISKAKKAKVYAEYVE